MPTCTTCGEPLEDDGLCPVCLFAGGLAPSSISQETIADATPTTDSALEYDNFGVYEILSVLGEGGMGTVYLARQTAPIVRNVALKVVKPGMDTSQILARFNYERQALASMDHPNIARVYEAGATQKGRPYFVMEYIDGQPITTYCDTHRLTTRERLALFLPVCQALQHAHQKGVIHRDIKPSNVLITEVDGQPIPKIIDFGIAKATDQRNFENTNFTQLGQLIGTPEYMSPEAADVMNGDVDTSSDVYSLGILLYELLIGAVPFDGKSLRKAGLVELMRIIREVEAPPMTAKLTQMGNGATEIASRRRTDLPGLKRAVKGDLNWIVTKAVEKSRHRRYSSAGDLLADIDRHLDNRPVTACPPSTLYRVQKFVRRNRPAVLGGAAVAVALIAGLTTTLWQSREAIRQRDAAQQALHLAEQRQREALEQRALAESRSAEAQAQRLRAEAGEAASLASLNDVRRLATTMLVELDEKVRPLSGATPAREALARLGAEYLSRAASSDPMLGLAFFRMGELEGEDGRGDHNAARRSYTRAIQLTEQRLRQTPNDPDLNLQLATTLIRSGRIEFNDQAKRTTLLRAQSLLNRILGKSPNHIPALHAMAAAQIGLGNPEAALKLEDHVASLGATTPADRIQHADAYASLAETRYFGEDAAKHQQYLQKAITEAESILKTSPAHMDARIRLARWNLALSAALMVTNQKEQGIRANTLARDIAHALVLEDPSRHSLKFIESEANMNLGGWSVISGDPAAGLKTLRAALDGMRQLAAANPTILNYTTTYATSVTDIQSLGRFLKDPNIFRPEMENAIQLLRSSLQHYPTHSQLQRHLISAHATLAQACTVSKQFPCYQTNIDQAHTLALKLTRSTDVAENWLELAGVLHHRAEHKTTIGQLREAIADRQLALTHLDRASRLSPDSTRIFSAKQDLIANLSQNLQSALDFPSTLALNERYLPEVEARFQKNPNSGLSVEVLRNRLFWIRAASLRLSNYDKAVATATRSLQIAEQLLSNSPGDISAPLQVANAYVNLVNDLAYAGRRQQAISSVQRGASFIAGEIPRTKNFPFLRARLLNNYQFLVRNLSATLEEPLAAIPLARTSIEWSREFLASSPEAKEPLETMEIANRDAANAARLAGLLPEAHQWTLAALDACQRRNPATILDFRTIATYQATAASLANRLGTTTATNPTYPQAIASLKSAANIAESQLKASPRNLAALRALQLIHDQTGTLYTLLKDQPAATESARAAWRATESIAALDPNSEQTRFQQRRMEGRLALATGQSSPSLTSGIAATIETANSIAVAPASLLPLATRAVALDRDHYATHPNNATRAQLARSLTELSNLHLLIANLAQPRQRTVSLQTAQTLMAESVNLLQQCQTSNQPFELPNMDRDFERNARLSLANLDAFVSTTKPTPTDSQLRN